jgi:hypothetical protein
MLPPFDIRIKQQGQRRQVLDILRRKYVTLTPEEWVRQHFVNYLIAHKGYPKGLLANEVELQVGEKRLRCDTLLYNQQLQPRMIIEYKAPDIEITERVFNQIMAYNQQLHVDYLIMSNGHQHFCCKMDYEQNQYQFLPDIPSYDQL